MKVITGSSSNLVNTVVEKINSALQEGFPVALFMSGGSSLVPEAEIVKRLSQLEHADKIHILPVDERFGKPGHLDANLIKLKISQYRKIHVHDILDGSSFKKTIANFKNLFCKYHRAPFKTFAILGVGMDGHIGGNIPESPAANSQEMVEGFQDQVFQRITLTPPAIRKIDTIFVSAFGKNKAEILQRLVSGPKTGLPMEILHTHREVYVFTDNKIPKE